jgi:hypothetical protein
MIDLFMAVNKENKVLFIKYNDDVSVVPAWREKIKAKQYLFNQQWGDEFQIIGFSFDLFDKSRDWAKNSGISLFIHILD